MMLFAKWKKVLLLICIVMVIAACKPSEMPRDKFQVYAIDKTVEEVIAKFGKPAEENRKDPDRPVLIYYNRTFDTDNYNVQDPKTRVVFEKNKEGRMVCTSVEFAL
jgi:hypothetical protein